MEPICKKERLPVRGISFLVGSLIGCGLVPDRAPAEDPVPAADQVKAAAARALTLLQTASIGSADQRKCFNCHGQAMPVITIVESRRHGLDIDAINLKRQVDHTYDHLKRGRKSYLEGKGQGGGVDTAGYALWTLEDGGRQRDEVVDIVTDWILQEQKESGGWRCRSHRPPSEASDFTTTYLALRSVSHFGRENQQQQIKQATVAATRWLVENEGKDTEDQVFRLLSLVSYAEQSEEISQTVIDRLKQQQRDDGGWSQKPNMKSDAYATGTVLYALLHASIDSDDQAIKDGIRYLLQTQHEDGSWMVESRAKPFQKYFESGFPHGKNQFISMTATAWATIALLQSLGR